MSKFTPVNEDDYKTRNLLPAGWYPATISDSSDGVTEKMSANNNLMFETKFQVFNDNGGFKLVTSYVMAEGKAAFQLRSCAEAFGFLDEYRAGRLTEDDMKGKSGFVKLAIAVDQSGQYPDKNTIADFKKTMPGTVKAADLPKAQKPKTKAEAEKDMDDSIPF